MSTRPDGKRENAFERVGVIGTGTMGGGMARRLLDQGYSLAVWNRTPYKSAELARLGATAAGSPAEVAHAVGVVLVSLADEAAVESALFGPDGVFRTLRPGGIVVDASTVSPAFAADTASRAERSGHYKVDACVLGNGQHARDGELRFMVGGPDEVVSTIRPLLHDLAKQVVHFGASGRGASMKLLLNMLMGIEMQALAEAVSFGERAGLDRDTVLSTIAASGFSAPVMRFKCNVMRRRAYDTPDFRLALMRKDLSLLRHEAQQLGAVVPAADAAYTVLTSAVNEGIGERDCAAVLDHMERVCGVPVPDSDQRQAA